MRLISDYHQLHIIVQPFCSQFAHSVLLKILKMHEQDVVAAVELAFYIPTTILAIFVCARHGFNRSSGWIYTLILCIVRVVGAIIQLQSRHNPSNGLIEAKIIVDSIGISPLLLATLGLLSRLYVLEGTCHSQKLTKP